MYDYQNLEDEELYKLLCRDDEAAEKAFTEIYARYSPRVFAYCRRFLGDFEAARDIFQDTFLRFLNSAKNDKEHPKDIHNILSYLVLIARNICINHKRSERVSYSFDENIDVNLSDNHQNNDEMLNLIKIGLDLIPADYRELFVLREYEGFSYEQISNVTGIPKQNVKVRIHRARQKLREVLAPYIEDLH
jgi:RNA polymerase sigma-70 factor (ECF subfamily)